MEKVLVTCVCGRIGYRLSQRLQDFYQVIGIDFINPKEEKPPFDFFNIDYSSKESVEKGFQSIFEKHGKTFHSDDHIAAYYSFEGGSYEPDKKITVQGTKMLLEQLSRTKTKQLIFSSTLLIYAPCLYGTKINEDSEIRPIWNYPLSKLEAENLIFNRKEENSSVILTIVGCYEEDCFSLPLYNQIQRIYEKDLGSYFYPGDFKSGSPYLQFLINSSSTRPPALW